MKCYGKIILFLEFKHFRNPKLTVS